MDYASLKAKAEREWAWLENLPQPLITIGMGTCGRASGAGEVLATIRKTLKSIGILARIMEVGCIGMCYAEPLMGVRKPGNPTVYYGGLTPEKTEMILTRYLCQDDPCRRWAEFSCGNGEIEPIPPMERHPMMRPQVRIALRNCGIIDPTNIDHYVARGGYSGLNRALDMPPEAVIKEIKRFRAARPRRGRISHRDEMGLRPPGSRPTPNTWSATPMKATPARSWTARSWKATHMRSWKACSSPPMPSARPRATSTCAPSTRWPSSGWRRPSPSMRALRPAGRKRPGHRLQLPHRDQGGRRGLRLRRGDRPDGLDRGRAGHAPAPAAVPRRSPACGASPPTSTTWKPSATSRPSCSRGRNGIRRYGTEKSKGTKTFSLAGKISRTGLIEVPMGITLRRHHLRHRRRRPQGQVPQGGADRGPVRRLYPAPTCFDLPVDYETLAAAGSIMGSGGMVVMDEDTCMVDVARYFLDFTQAESCGKCMPCRLGTRQMLDILEDICHGQRPTGGSRPSGRPERDGPKGIAVRFGPDRAQPRPYHTALFPRGIRKPCPPAQVYGRCLPGPLPL